MNKISIWEFVAIIIVVCALAASFVFMALCCIDCKKPEHRTIQNFGGEIIQIA